MKATAFAFERPGTVQQALASKRAWGGAARFLAGGQSLMPAINMRFNQPGCLIDLNGLDSLRGIQLDQGELRIGALARHAEVVGSALARQAAPLLVQAGRHLAHVAIRNRGTFGGSVALADPAAEWPAACLLLGARMRILGEHGAREVPADRFFQGLYATELGEDELLESVALPVQAAGERSCVLELARRQGDYASAAVMARAQVDSGGLRGLQFVFFAVADRPVLDAALNASVERAVQAGGLAEVPAVVTQAFGAHQVRADLYNTAKTKAYLCGVLARRAVEQLLGSRTEDE